MRSKIAALVILGVILCAPLTGCLSSDGPATDEEAPKLRMNEIQFKGTHNSYHLRPLGSEFLSNYNYSHAPLSTQAEDFGVRQFELDVWLLPGLGLRVYHNPYDSGTTCFVFTDCLQELKSWSDANQHHVPLWIMIEPKDHEWVVDGIDVFEIIEADIDLVWPRERRVEPDDVRNDRATLRRAVLDEGWPELDEVRGKAAFALLDKSEIRDAYMERNEGLVNATMFAIVDEDDPAAALISWTQPESKFDIITNAVDMGFIVRTRPDSDTVEAQSDNRTRMQLAIDSGAHILSTDFPGNDENQTYALWPTGEPVIHCNPRTAPPDCELHTYLG